MGKKRPLVIWQILLFFEKGYRSLFKLLLYVGYNNNIIFFYWTTTLYFLIWVKNGLLKGNCDYMYSWGLAKILTIFSVYLERQKQARKEKAEAKHCLVSDWLLAVSWKEKCNGKEEWERKRSKEIKKSKKNIIIQLPVKAHRLPIWEICRTKKLILPSPIELVCHITRHKAAVW